MTDYDEIKIGVSFEEVTTGVPSIAYEGFDYLENDIDSTMNGGVGFAGPWTDAPPSTEQLTREFQHPVLKVSEGQGRPVEMVLVRSATSKVPTAPPVNQRRFTTHWSLEPILTIR